MSLQLLKRRCVPAVLTAFLLTGCGDSESPAPESGGSTSAGVTAEPSQTSAQELVQEAVTLIQRKDFNSAIDRLNKAILADPRSADAHFQRAGILADAGQDKLALADYSKAIELQPNDVRFLNMRGLFLLTRKQLDAAFADFSLATDKDPKYVQAWNNRGLVHLARNEIPDAIKDFSRAVEIDPNYSDGFNNRGFAWFQSGENAKALQDFNTTLKLRPDYVNAYNNRGTLFLKLKQFREAASDFSEAIQRDENNPRHYQNRRTAWLELGMTEQAEQDAAKLAWLIQLGELNAEVVRNPQKAAGYLKRASHLASGGHHEVALANFEQAAKAEPDRPDSWINRAQYWYDIGDFQKAITDATTALEKEYSHQALSIRADAFLSLQRFDEAIADFVAAKRLDPSVAEAYYQRSLKHQRVGNSAAAESDLEQARLLNPQIGQH